MARKQRPEAIESLISGKLEINILIAFVFGVIFLVTIIIFAVLFPNPSDFQVWVFVAALALAAGGIGAALPGSFDIQYKGFIRAGGALGLVALVYLNQPTIKSNTIKFQEPPVPAGPVADRFLAALDSADLQGSWDQLDSESRGSLVSDAEQWSQIYANYRKPLGSIVRRELTGSSSITSPQGFPVGLYRALVYRTQFSNSKDCRVEAVNLRATQKLEWRVFSYQISPNIIPC